ncbi:helix-turn-helix domain-containing protein [Marinactinospora rubrisoli]|uniref:Helix-turn-helix domain-containing protein n=1 Tax=Marinactinospora rubrisoli TaxID=2715399 RepID=A0ABW2KLN3_9ACTN
MPSTDDIRVDGARLAHLRKRRRWSLAHLGQQVGRSPGYLSRIENGKRDPSWELVERLAEALEVPATDFVAAAPTYLMEETCRTRAI